VHYGSDGAWVYLRLDLVPGADFDGVMVNVRSGESVARVPLAAERFEDASVTACCGTLLEMRLALASFGKLSLEVEQDGILRQRLPVTGEFEPCAAAVVAWGV